jgi:hypothetical protein
MPIGTGPSVSDTPESHRPLPPRPDIEYEKKRAKRLLRDARAGDATAFRTMARVAGATPPSEYQLALAQLAVAREYGFSSWLRLTQYYAMWGRHALCPKYNLHPIEQYESQAKTILLWHQRRLPLGAQLIATFLPRLYGRPVEQVLDSTLTEEDARFIVARQERRASWEELAAQAPTLEQAKSESLGLRGIENAEGVVVGRSPFGEALAAMEAQDLPRLREVTAAHPDLLGTVIWNGGETTLLRDALIFEERDPAPAAREISDWLASMGGDLEEHLSINLARNHLDPEKIEYLISRGANPNWVSAAGVTTIEYALIMYNLSQSNPEAVDALAKNVNPVPKALWIAAGLGDVRGTLSYFDGQGKLKPSARERRLDLNLMMPSSAPFQPDATDAEIIWDAYYVAGLNGRAKVLEALVWGGHIGVDAAPWHSTLLHSAVGVGSYATVKCLLDLGADPDAPQLWNRSPRWLATNMKIEPPLPERDRIRDLLAAAPGRSHSDNPRG